MEERREEQENGRRGESNIKGEKRQEPGNETRYTPFADIHVIQPE